MINLVPLNPGKMRHIFLLMTMLLYISGEGYLLIECTSIDTEASVQCQCHEIYMHRSFLDQNSKQ